MSTHDYKALAVKFYDTLLAGDLPALLEMLAPDILITNPMPYSVPFGGTYRGREGMQTYLGQIFETLELTLTVDKYLAEGSSVVAFGYEDSLVKPTGRRYEMNWVHHLTFDEAGLMTGFHEYNPTARIAEAFAGNRP